MEEKERKEHRRKEREEKAQRELWNDWLPKREQKRGEERWNRSAKRKKSNRNKHADIRRRIIKRTKCAQHMKWIQNALMVPVGTQELQNGCAVNEGWLHCVCTGVSHKLAGKQDYVFICCNCS